MADSTIHEPRRGLSFDDVWAALMELKEYQKESERLFRESRAEMDRLFRESHDKNEQALLKSREENDQAFLKSREETEQALLKSREETERALLKSREENEQALLKSREENERAFLKSREENEQALLKSREENERAFLKSREENDQALRVLRHEIEQELKEASRIVKELSLDVGGVSNRLGEVAQCFFGSELWRHFDGFEYEFQRLYPYLPLFDDKNKSLGDIDITLLNGEYVMAIEVKTHLKRKNVEYHAKRLGQIKKYPPDQYKGRKLLGGMAGLMIDPDAKDLANELGIYIIEQSGDAVRLAERPEWFKAHEW
jgi:hypothetical protein